MNHKYLKMFMLAALVLLASTGGLYAYSRIKNRPRLDPLTKRGEITTQDKIDYRYESAVIRMNNFIEHPVRRIDDEVLYIADTLEYGITYWPNENKFRIHVLLQPVKDNSLIAEDKLLSLLGITDKQACQLPIIINGPISLDTQFWDDKEYQLSFCPGSHLN